MNQRLSVHTKLAMLYLTINLPILGIVLLSDTFTYTTRQNYFIFVLIVAAVIFIAPLLVKLQSIKRHFCWTDALEYWHEGTPPLIKRRGIKPSVHFEKRVYPYLRNIGLLCASLFLLGSLTNSHVAVALVFGGIGMYLFFITVVIVVTIAQNRILLKGRRR